MRQRDYVRETADALADLNVFASIVALLESGLLYNADRNGAARRIIKISKAEQQKCLREYDRAKARASRKTEAEG